MPARPREWVLERDIALRTYIQCGVYSALVKLDGYSVVFLVGERIGIKDCSSTFT